LTPLATKTPETIDIDKILKVMRADLPANFDKGIFASELRKAESWYRVRSKIDKWPILFSNSGSGCQALQPSSLPGPLFSPR